MNTRPRLPSYFLLLIVGLLAVSTTFGVEQVERIGGSPSAADLNSALQDVWDSAAHSLATLPYYTGGNDAVNLQYRAPRAFLNAAFKGAPDHGANARRILQSSRNFLFRSAADGAVARAQLENKPIDMKFTALDGRVVDLGEMRGHVVLVDFASTWCGGCQTDEPILKDAYNKYHDKGLEIVSIYCDMDPHGGKTMADTRAKVTQYIAKHDLPWQFYFDGLGYDAFDRDSFEGDKPANPFFKQYSIDEMPTYFLIGKDGRLVRWDLLEERAHVAFQVPGYLNRRIEEQLRRK